MMFPLYGVGRGFVSDRRIQLSYFLVVLLLCNTAHGGDLAKKLSQLGFGSPKFQRLTMKPEEINTHACNQEVALTLSEGEIAYPFNRQQTYDNKAECNWIVLAPKGKVVKISFVAIDIECNDDVTVSNYVRGGPGHKIVRLCSSAGSPPVDPQHPVTVYTDSNAAHVHFRSDKRGGGTGFHILFSTVEGRCGLPRFVPIGYNVRPRRRLTALLAPSANDTLPDPFTLQSRLVGGSEAVPHTWPWMIAIRSRIGPKRELRRYCGAALIHPRWAITAAHCVVFLTTLRELTVAIGRHNITDLPFGSLVRVRSYTAHPSFDPLTYRGDVALLELEQELPFSATEAPVCLPTTHQPAGTVCVILGWGLSYKQDANPRGEELLNQAAVPIVKDKVCSQPDWLGRFLHPGLQFCAGYEEGGIDSCLGDSGGPLVCEVDGRWTIVGITSFGWSCALPKRPGVYTRVARYRNWILNTIRRAGG